MFDSFIEMDRKNTERLLRKSKASSLSLLRASKSSLKHLEIERKTAAQRHREEESRAAKKQNDFKQVTLKLAKFGTDIDNLTEKDIVKLRSGSTEQIKDYSRYGLGNNYILASTE